MAEDIEVGGLLATIVWIHETIIVEGAEIDLQDAIEITTPKGTEAGIETTDIKVIEAVDLTTTITVGESITRDHRRKSAHPKNSI